MITKQQKKELNALLHKYLRLKWDDKCLKCGKKKVLSLSHLFPKGKYRGLEFDEQNCILLCFSCHIGWFHKNPIEASAWIKEILPKKQYDYLKLRSQMILKGAREYKLIKIYLENLIKTYENQRRNFKDEQEGVVRL